MAKASSSWNKLLIERLKDKEEALAYLNAVLEDTKDGSDESQRVLSSALNDIAKAQGGLSNFFNELENASFGKKMNALFSSIGFNLKAHLAINNTKK